MRKLKFIIKCLHTVLYYGSVVLPLLAGSYSAICSIENFNKEKKA